MNGYGSNQQTSHEYSAGKEGNITAWTCMLRSVVSFNEWMPRQAQQPHHESFCLLAVVETWPSIHVKWNSEGHIAVTVEILSFQIRWMHILLLIYALHTHGKSGKLQSSNNQKQESYIIAKWKQRTRGQTRSNHNQAIHPWNKNQELTTCRGEKK